MLRSALFYKSSFRTIFNLISFFFVTLSCFAQTKHIYLANDNHTDYYWSGNAESYKNVALNELDYYINLTNATAHLPSAFQSRYNLDAAWYVYEYQKHRSAAQFNELINKIKSKHISLPYNHLVSTYGGQPTEAILRGMYWTGALERKYDLPINLAMSMENQTQPLGLASLWAGAGAKYSWKGVCGCSSPVTNVKLANRSNEIYHYRGLDQHGVLMKWYSQLGDQKLGGYAEARFPQEAITECNNKCNTPAYPYQIAGAFGYGWDDLEARTDEFPRVAQSASTAQTQVHVSNQMDFFEHFTQVHNAANLPAESLTYGNDWDTDCASLANPTAKIRNAVEKLRTAEALASVITLSEPTFYRAEDSVRAQVWTALGSYWEHNFGGGGCCLTERGEWLKGLQQQITTYVDSFYETALNALASHVQQLTDQNKILVFNSLGWQRTDIADLVYNGDKNIRVVDTRTNATVAHEFITKDGISYLRILAANVPTVGYRIYSIQPAENSTTAVTATLNGNIFENNFFRLQITPQGVITSLIDKVNNNQELVKLTNGRYLNDFGQSNRSGGTMQLLHNGAVSAMLACTGADPLSHTTYITLYKHINRIDIFNRINDEFGDTIRSYTFSFNVNNPTVWHEELGAVLKVKYTTNGGHYATPDQPVRHEWQTLNHFVEVGNDRQGITLSNQGAAFMKVGASSLNFLDEASAQINVLIGGRMANSGVGLPNQLGFQTFENAFSLRPRQGAFDAASAMRFALEHQNPFVVKLLPRTPATFLTCPPLPADTFSLLKISHPNTLLWALKPSEEGFAAGGLIARLWNMDTLQRRVALDFVTDLLDAKKTTHLETDVSNAGIDGSNLLVEMGQRRLETFRLRPVPLSTSAERFTVDASICAGERYESYTQSGVYRDTFNQPGGCLRLRTLNLTVLPVSSQTISASICAGATYEGYAISGVYRDTFTNVAGCDSIRTLQLTVYPPIDTIRIQAFTCDSMQSGITTQRLQARNGCDSIVIKTLTYRPIRFDLQKTDAACATVNNGQITTNASADYTYHWSTGARTPSLSDLSAGIYTLTVSDPVTGCHSTISVSIRNQTTLRVALAGQEDYCVNSFVTAIVTDGFPPYNYRWSTGDTTQSILGVQAGRYYVSVSDVVGCQATDSIFLEDITPLQISIEKQDARCFGVNDGRVQLMAKGGVPPYQVQWSHGPQAFQLENLPPGTYGVSFSDAQGCNVNKTVVIKSPNELKLNLTIQQSTPSAGGKATVMPSGGRSPYAILWSTGSPNNQIDNLKPGQYAVTVTDFNNCQVTSAFDISTLTSSSMMKSLQKFHLYPNPTSEQLQVLLHFTQPEHGVLFIHDLNGKELYRNMFSGERHYTSINTQHFAPGVYQLFILTDRQYAVKSFIVK